MPRRISLTAPRPRRLDRGEREAKSGILSRPTTTDFRQLFFWPGSGDEEDEKRPSTSADEEKSAEAAAAAGESIDNKDSNDGVAVKTEATVAPPRKTSVIFADRKVSPPAGGESSRIGNGAAQTAR